MRRRLDLIIILFISVLVCGVLYLLYDNTNEFSMPKNGNITMSRGGGSRIIPRGSVNGGTWAPEGISGGLSSSRSVRVSPQTYRRNSMQATSSNGSLISSSRSLMSNRTANTVSIVGGNNASFGRTAEANMSQPLAYSGGAGYPSVNVPSMRSANPVVAAAPAYVGVDAGAMSAPYQSFPTVSAPNYGNSSSGILLHGGNILSDATPMYGTSGPIYKAPPGLGGGGAAGSDSNEDSGGWVNWLDYTYGDEEKESGKNGWTKNEDGWTKTFTEEEAEGLYDDMMDYFYTTVMGKEPPTKDAFLEWLRNGGGTKDGNTYQMPIGDVAPLFLLAFAYLAMLLFRRRIN